jgi:hypothetical protein
MANRSDFMRGWVSGWAAATGVVTQSLDCCDSRKARGDVAAAQNQGDPDRRHGASAAGSYCAAIASWLIASATASSMRSHQTKRALRRASSGMSS